MHKKLRFEWKNAAAILSLSVLTLAGAKTLAHANGIPVVIELAHSQILDASGSTSFIKSKDGSYDFIQFTPKKVGDFVTFGVRMPQGGHYHLQTTMYKEGDEGIYSIEVDGNELDRKDLYVGDVWDVGDFDVKPGDYKVTYRCVGKNPKSSGVGVKLGNLHFR